MPLILKDSQLKYCEWIIAKPLIFLNSYHTVVTVHACMHACKCVCMHTHIRIHTDTGTDTDIDTYTSHIAT